MVEGFLTEKLPVRPYGERKLRVLSGKLLPHYMFCDFDSRFEVEVSIPIGNPLCYFWAEGHTIPSYLKVVDRAPVWETTFSIDALEEPV